MTLPRDLGQISTGSHNTLESSAWSTFLCTLATLHLDTSGKRLQAVETTNVEVRGPPCAWRVLLWKMCFHYADSSNVAEEIHFLEFFMILI